MRSGSNFSKSARGLMLLKHENVRKRNYKTKVCDRGDLIVLLRKIHERWTQLFTVKEQKTSKKMNQSHGIGIKILFNCRKIQWRI